MRAAAVAAAAAAAKARAAAARIATTTEVASSSGCAVVEGSGMAITTGWCINNCAVGNCPDNLCSPECRTPTKAEIMVSVEKKNLERQAKKLGLLSKKGEVAPEAAKAEVAALHAEYHDELSLEDEELA